MSVTVATLSKLLLAEPAGERSYLLMRAHVVQHIAELAELLVAGEALEHLVLAAGLLVHVAHLAVALVLLNCLLQSCLLLQCHDGRRGRASCFWRSLICRKVISLILFFSLSALSVVCTFVIALALTLLCLILWALSMTHFRVCVFLILDLVMEQLRLLRCNMKVLQWNVLIMIKVFFLRVS